MAFIPKAKSSSPVFHVKRRSFFKLLASAIAAPTVAKAVPEVPKQHITRAVGFQNTIPQEGVLTMEMIDQAAEDLMVSGISDGPYEIYVGNGDFWNKVGRTDNLFGTKIMVNEDAIQPYEAP